MSSSPSSRASRATGQRIASRSLSGTIARHTKTASITPQRATDVVPLRAAPLVFARRLCHPPTLPARLSFPAPPDALPRYRLDLHLLRIAVRRLRSARRPHHHLVAANALRRRRRRKTETEMISSTSKRRALRPAPRRGVSALRPNSPSVTSRARSVDACN